VKPRDIEADIAKILSTKSQGDQGFIDGLYKSGLKERSRDRDDWLIKVALVSDFHVDPYYVEGANTQCDDIICCRAESNVSALYEPKKAGKWGDYNCDLPQRTMDSLVDHISSKVKPDFVMWGGDSSSHDSTTQSFNRTVDELTSVSKHVLSGLKDYPLFAAIGNHDAYPQDMIQANGEFNEAIKAWMPAWDPIFTNDVSREQFHKTGSYSQQLVTAKDIPFTKVISLNTVFCYASNYENMAYSEDPDNLLDWLESELASLEPIGGVAILLAHVPNLDECNR
jgi:sphingomyelin phosphodiesterase